MSFKSVLLIIIVVVVETSLCEYNKKLRNDGNCPNVKTSLGSVRKRRHLAFPTGSVVSLITSVVKTFMTHVPAGWYVVAEGEIIYTLPDEKFIAASLRRKLHHRQKKEVWELIQNGLERGNINGRACVIRAVCEAQMYLASKGKSLVHDIIRTIFTAPLHEKDFIEEVGDSYDEILEKDFCEKPNDCPLSFLSLLLELNKQGYR